MIDTERLIRKAAAYGIDAAPVVRKLDEYAALLVEYNQKVNLTAITDAEGIEDRHFIDSLLLAARPEVCGRMVDVGTGAGFPGIVAKLFRPELDLTLMEPTGKRAVRWAWKPNSPRSAQRKPRASNGARALTWPRPGPWPHCRCWPSIACPC
jgi:16S rRNA (guanine527-N7)-methyltransferase